MDDQPPVTSLTVFTFAGVHRVWAFGQMALARPLLWRVPGLRFHQLMGAGQGLGFTLAPDWNRYALLAVWDDQAAARRFLARSAFMRRYRQHATRSTSVLLRTIQAHGSWGGRNPFMPAGVSPDPAAPVAVLTRATIRLSRLRAFWSQVGPVSAELASAPGLRASIGVGEAPFVRQATFSVWDNAAAVRAFAYAGPLHRATIRRTRDEAWYRESLFARFAVLAMSEPFP
ncbi:MAG TPA: spheroidene monooxygenase [Chloroflexia bacterium]|nr:spheroidene monooxygenase [Chloroflexia bacterium]